jgi:hypothetical protein
MRRIETAIDIAASPDRVWAALIDFAAYPDWNPFIRRLQGEAGTGARLAVTIEPPGGRALTFKPRVLIAQPGRELRWLGHFILPGLFDGEHSFRLEPTATGCRLHQDETFRGLLVGLLSAALENTARGFEAMNAALKQRVEGGR